MEVVVEVVTVGAVFEGVSNKRKLSIPHSSFEPSEKTRINKFIVVPVPAIDLVNSLNALVNWVPSPQPSPSVSSKRYLSPIPLALPLLKKRIKLLYGPPSILYSIMM